jgi:Protein of unknown function (DUF3710)
VKFRRKAKHAAESDGSADTPSDAGSDAGSGAGADSADAGDTQDDATKDEATQEAATAESESEPDAEPGAGAGPRDFDDTEEADREDLVDLGSLLVGPIPGFELRLQVEESTQKVQSAQLVASDGVIDLRAFAAPRNGDLWGEVRPSIKADHERRGGKATEHDGDFGPELRCELPVKRQDGSDAIQPTRIIGINGPRWLLRATMLGRPAVQPDQVGAFDAALDKIVVNRGTEAMAPGDALPLRLPASAKRLD